MKLLSKFRRNASPLKAPTAIADGVTHGEGGTWAWVQIPSRSTDEQNTEAIFRMTSEGANDLRRLIPSGAEFHFKVQWGRWTADDYLREEMTPGMSDGARAYVQLGATRIEDNAYARRLVLLGVRLDEEGLTHNGFAARTGKIVGTSTATQDATAALEKSMKRIRSWHERMATSSFQARPATVPQLAWSLRRDLRRTVDWVPSGPIASPGEIVRLKTTQVIPAVDHVEITTSDGTPRYLRMITTSEKGFPTVDLELPGGEWLKNLNVFQGELGEDTGTSGHVEVSIRGRNVPVKDASKRLREALALAKEQDREARQGLAEEAPDAVAESAMVLRQRIKEVSQGLVGMIEDAVVWVVEADNLEALEIRTQSLIDFYGTMGITCWAPPSIQDLLWKELVIGDTRRVPEFAQFRPWPTLVGAWFHGGGEVGSDRGMYLAANIGSTPGPFRNRLTDAQLEGEAITTAFLGRSGAGKTTAAMLSLAAEVITRRAWGMLNDLKGDAAGVATLCEAYGVRVSRITTGQAASGSMCPFRYVPDPAEAASFAVDNLSMMLSPQDANVAEGHLRRAANAVAAGPDRDAMSTWAVVEYLVNDPDPIAAEIGMKLRELGKDPLVLPVAGKPDLTAPMLSTEPGLIYLQFEGMRWPGKDTARADWKPGERLTMMLVGAAFMYATFMATRVKGIPKILALTELHLLTKYDVGRDLVANVARLGRALDVNLLLDTQACAELVAVSGLLDQISQVHAFRVKYDSEADAQAIMLGLEPEQTIRNRQKSWDKGQCLTRDRHGRIGPIEFDYMAEDIKQMLRTKPERDTDDDTVSGAGHAPGGAAWQNTTPDGVDTDDTWERDQFSTTHDEAIGVPS